MEIPDFILSFAGPEALGLIPGNELTPCAGCGRSLTVSPSTKPLREAGVPVLCQACAPDADETPLLLEAQRQEIETSLGRPYPWQEYQRDVDQTRKLMRRRGGARDTAPTLKEVP